MAWYHLQHAYTRLQVYTKLDNFYSRFYKAATLRYKSGETNKLEMISAQGQQAEIRLQKKRSKANIQVYLYQLKELLNLDQPISTNYSKNAKADLPAFSIDAGQLWQSPLLQYKQQKIEVAKSQTKLEKSKLLPSLNAGYAVQQVNGESGFYKFQVGIGISLWFRPQQGRIQAAKTETKIRLKQFEQHKLTLNSRFNQLMEKYKQTKSFLNYYESQGL